MATFLPALYDCNSTRGSKDISIYLIFGHFLFWSIKCTIVQKNIGHIQNFVLLSINLQKYITLASNEKFARRHFSLQVGPQYGLRFISPVTKSQHISDPINISIKYSSDILAWANFNALIKSCFISSCFTL